MAHFQNMQLLIQLTYLSLILISSLSYAATDDNDEPAVQENTHSTESLQQTAGIKTQRLQATSQQSELTAQGLVSNLEPLLMLRQQYLSAQAQQDSAQARYQEANINLSRTKNLHQQDIVSSRRLQEQQAQWQNDKANLAASSYQQQTIMAASRLQWGDKLTNWFTQNNNQQAEQFLNHSAQLLQITLPANTHLPDGLQAIAVDAHGRREQAITATLISAAPQVDPITQGERYFFKSEGQKLAYGAHIQAWIPLGTEKNSGVIIPETAVVWHLGQAFVFIKAEDGTFKRRLLPALNQAETGYFAASGFTPAEEIVTTGAQTLLSQELKALIPSEDSD